MKKQPAADFGQPIVSNNEPKIRETISEVLSKRYPESILIPEFCGGNMTTRCDIMCITPSELIMVEVKGNKDTLSRLEYQIHDYWQYSTTVIVAIDVVHTDQYNKQFSKFKPHHLLIYKDGKLIDKRPHGFNDGGILLPTAVNLLWAEEKRQFFKDFDHKKKIPNVIDAIFYVFTPTEISKMVNEIVYNRQKYLSQKEIRYHNGYTGGILESKIPHFGHKQLLLNEYLSTILKKKLF